MPTDQTSNQPDSNPASAAISPAMRSRLQRCFERGSQLTHQEKPDYDYAHTMFVECVVNDPSNLEYAEAMLDNLQRKYKNNKRGARIKGFGGKGAFKQACTDEDWPAAFRTGLDILKTNPWDVPTLRALAEACEANRYNEVELRYLKNAMDVNHKDIGVLKHCAESLGRVGQFDQAITLWSKIGELKKGDMEAKTKMSQLTMAKTMGASALEPTDTKKKDKKAKPSKTKKDDEPSAAKKEESPKSEREQLEASLASNPADEQSCLKLAELHTQELRFQKAEEVLSTGLAAAGSANIKLMEALEDAQIRSAKNQLAVAEKRAAAEKTDDATELARGFRSELNRCEMQVYLTRCDRYPDNKKLRYEVAIRLKREQNYREAAKYFDEARSEPEVKLAATLEMGECYQQLRKYTNAMKCYRAAVNIEGDPARHKLSLYRAAVLATALKDAESAQTYLSELVKLDPEFKDASARLDKVRQIDNKG